MLKVKLDSPIMIGAYIHFKHIDNGLLYQIALRIITFRSL